VSGLADEHQPEMDDLIKSISEIPVGQFLLSTVSTLASLAYGKLEQRELAQAKVAIEAIRALLPLLEGQAEDELRRDFERALANLQVAYADAASAPSD
jgi:hypothetical protein